MTLLFLAMSVAALIHLRLARRLPGLKELPPNLDQKKVRCSVVLAARDEEERIENTIRFILAQSEVEVEVIVVDDRSTDRTSEIIKRIAAEDSRVRARRIEVLPDGWLGKCHACHIGAGMATGEWLLFTDADCWLKPDVIARALTVATREKVQHVALTPGVVPQTIPGRAWHLAFLISFASWFSRVNQDKPRAYFGMGAFNLIKTDTYKRFGGYEALRLTLLDDVRLGLLVRRAGGRTRAFIGGDDVECHWGHSARVMIKLMEKNYFAAMNFRTEAACGAGIIVLVLALLTIVGPFTGTFMGLTTPLAWFSMALPAAVCARRLGWGMAAVLMTPFVFPLLIYAMLNSAAVTLRQNGIWWRETFYSLQQLRAGGVK
ncbi:MAG TPA: glycosyltransferase family 2 protein [Candidatus Eisenbacteria bacterium]|nr:glycosyltransferase family 2 protein [Candidatus Eisenbacteria bacterium]